MTSEQDKQVPIVPKTSEQLRAEASVLGKRLEQMMREGLSDDHTRPVLQEQLKLYDRARQLEYHARKRT